MGMSITRSWSEENEPVYPARSREKRIDTSSFSPSRTHCPTHLPSMVGGPGSCAIKDQQIAKTVIVLNNLIEFPSAAELAAPIGVDLDHRRRAVRKIVPRVKKSQNTRPHSIRSAVIGSTFVARRAGT